MNVWNSRNLCLTFIPAYMPSNSFTGSQSLQIASRWAPLHSCVFYLIEIGWDLVKIDKGLWDQALHLAICKNIATVLAQSWSVTSRRLNEPPPNSRYIVLERVYAYCTITHNWYSQSFEVYDIDNENWSRVAIFLRASVRSLVLRIIRSHLHGIKCPIHNF